MAQGPSDTILVAIQITLWIWESKVRNLSPRLFAVYLDDIMSLLPLSQRHCIILYADDILIILPVVGFLSFYLLENPLTNQCDVTHSGYLFSF